MYSYSYINTVHANYVAGTFVYVFTLRYGTVVHLTIQGRLDT